MLLEQIEARPGMALTDLTLWWVLSACAVAICWFIVLRILTKRAQKRADMRRTFPGDAPRDLRFSFLRAVNAADRVDSALSWLVRVAFIVLVLAGCALLWAWVTSQRSSEIELPVWEGFAKRILAAGMQNDRDALLDVTLWRVADIPRIKEEIQRNNPEFTFVPPAQPPSDAETHHAMANNAQLFLDSYRDLLDGELASVATARLKTKKMYSLIIWVKKSGVFHGILIDSVWRNGDELKVVAWVNLDPFETEVAVVAKKRALLDSSRLKEGTYPSLIEFEIEGVGRQDREWVVWRVLERNTRIE